LKCVTNLEEFFVLPHFQTKRPTSLMRLILPPNHLHNQLIPNNQRKGEKVSFCLQISTSPNGQLEDIFEVYSIAKELFLNHFITIWLVGTSKNCIAKIATIKKFVIKWILATIFFLGLWAAYHCSKMLSHFGLLLLCIIVSKIEISSLRT